MSSRRRTLLALPVLAALALAGCAAPAETGSGDGSEGLRIVAVTDVYGDIAERVAGDSAEVTSLITSAAQDPHSYEATARDRLAVQKADIVIRNGGGYDDFLTTLLPAEGGPLVLDVVALSEHAAEAEAAGAGHEADGDPGHEGHGHEGHDHGAFNEHVWYDLAAVDALATALRDELSTRAPESAATVTAGYDALHGELRSLQDRVTTMSAEVTGREILATEPVPLYLFADLGLVNRTPEAFSAAVEAGSDVSPALVKETLDILRGGQIAFLAVNLQSAGAEVESLRIAASDAGIGVVDFSETLPEGEDYLSWMTLNLDRIAEALSA